MKIKETDIEGLIIFEPDVHGDHRGYFLETYNEKHWNDNFDRTPSFVQDNESMSNKGVLRGLHFQKPPCAQGKLVRVVKGSVLDVAVDLRKDSSTYGEHHSIVLSGENKKQFFIPPGFAHGFLTLEDKTIFSYKCTEFYSPENEGGLSWDDPDLSIDWGIENPQLSEKDKDYTKFRNFTSPF